METFCWEGFSCGGILREAFSCGGSFGLRDFAAQPIFILAVICVQIGENFEVFLD